MSVARRVGRATQLNRDRTFDPRNWDNAPDAGGEDGDLPRFFDRDYLEKRARGEDPA